MSFLSIFFGGGLRGVLDGADSIISKFKLELEASDALKVDKEVLG